MSDSPMPDMSLIDSDDADLIPRDKLFEHHRRQLSAMLDGELPPDQAKFMLRRLQHDRELAACWERWQVCGDVLRGRHDVLLPADFSQRVTAAIAAGDLGGAEASPSASAAAASMPIAPSSPRWLRWSGGALAASVALVAMMFARAPTAPGLVDPAGDGAATRVTSVVATGSAPAGTALPTAAATEALADTSQALTPTSRMQRDGVPDRTAGLAAAAAVAVASAPRRDADRERRSTRSQAQRAGVRLRDGSANAATPQLASATQAGSPLFVDARAPAAIGGAALDPFATRPIAPARPWPRAIAPGYPAGGAFTASFGVGDAAAFHPFEPTATAPVVRDVQDAGSPPRGPR